MTVTSMEAPEVRYERKGRSKKPLKVGEALQCVVKKAFHQDRLLYGYLECAQFIKRHPESVVMCITQRNPNVKSEQHINRKLLEAFCTEKQVRLVQVDSCKKLTQDIVIPESNGKHRNDQNKPQDATSDDPSTSITEAECLLIQTSDVKTSDEEFIVTYHDFALYSTALPCPYITVPE